MKLRRYLLSNTQTHNIIKTHTIYQQREREREERRDRDKVRKGVIICTFFTFCDALIHSLINIQQKVWL